MHMVFGLQYHDNCSQRHKGAKQQRSKKRKNNQTKNLCFFAPFPLCETMPIFASQLNEPIFSTYEAFKIFI